MARIIVMNHVTLDGVMQGPGRPDEDTRGGFTQGGWGSRSTSPDDALGKAMGERMAAGGGLKGWLFGRRTYEDLLSTWNAKGGPFKDGLNNTPKYVASRTQTALEWKNSTVLEGDVPEAVVALKREDGGDLHVIVNVSVPTRLSKRQRELLEAYAKESGDAVSPPGGLREKLGL